MERVRDLFLYFVEALAMFALLCAVYQAMNDEFGSAAIGRIAVIPTASFLCVHALNLGGFPFFE